MVRRSRGGWISSCGMFLGFGMVLGAVIRIYQTQSGRYFPLLLVGLIMACISAPAYYYFKAKDKLRTPANSVEIQTLATLAEQPSADKSDAASH